MAGTLELQKGELAWTYKQSEDLVHPDQIPNLPTRMCQLHEWYKGQSGFMFCVVFKSSDIYHIGTDTYWIDFSSLFEFYQQQALVISIMGLFTP